MSLSARPEAQNLPASPYFTWLKNSTVTGQS